MAIKETTPTHTLGMPLHDCMHPPCCLSCVDTWFGKSLCHSPLDHDHHLQTAGKEEAGIGKKIASKGSIQTMAIKETTPTHTLGMPLHDCMHPPCCLSCVDTWFDKSLCHSPLDHDHHLQTAGKEEAGIGIKFARKEASKQWPSRKPLQPTL